MTATILMVTSAALFVRLGIAHPGVTFYGLFLTPRNAALQRRRQESSPGITTTTTMWRCWIGFTASHGLGAAVFGLIYGSLAIAHGSLLFNSPYLLAVGCVMIAGFVLPATFVWFRTPFVGTSVALACYVASVVATLA